MSLAEILTALGVLINTLGIIYFSYRKNKPEVKKLEVDVDSEIVEAANLNLEGAKTSQQILIDRINELKRQIDETKLECNSRISSIEQSRRDDLEYFRRRIKDLERDNRDWRSWASQLHKQVIDAGQIPAPFLPSVDTDTRIQKPRPELENKINSTE